MRNIWPIGKTPRNLLAVTIGNLLLIGKSAIDNARKRIRLARRKQIYILFMDLESQSFSFHLSPNPNVRIRCEQRTWSLLNLLGPQLVSQRSEGVPCVGISFDFIDVYSFFLRASHWLSLPSLSAGSIRLYRLSWRYESTLPSPSQVFYIYFYARWSQINANSSWVFACSRHELSVLRCKSTFSFVSVKKIRMHIRGNG